MNKLIAIILFLITPLLTYSQTASNPKFDWEIISSTGNIWIEGIATGADRCVYIACIANTTANISTPGAHQTTPGSTQDAFIAKTDSNGNIIWGTYYGGSNTDVIHDIVIDNDNNIYITGYTNSTSNIATNGSHRDQKSGGYDAFLVKLDSSGKRLWGTYFGNTGDDFGVRLVITKNNDILLAGTTNSNIGITTSGVYKPTYGGGGSDAFIAQFNALGTFVGATYLGGDKEERVNGLAVDDLNNIYIVGSTRSKIGLAVSGFQIQPGNYFDGYLAKFTSINSLAWATYYGGEYEDYTYTTTVDKSGNIYIAGSTSSLNGITTQGAHKTGIPHGYDAYIAKFNSAGNRLWGTYYGGYWHEQIHDIIVDDNNNIFVTGYTASDTGIATADAHQPLFGSNVDMFLARFDTLGILKYGSYYEARTTGRDHGNSLATDSCGNLYIGGTNDSGSTNYLLLKFCILSNLIKLQPQDATVQENKSVQFTVQVQASCLNYQWQVNTISGYVNVLNSSIYSGATTNTLKISKATPSDSGKMFRCIISNDNCIDTTSEAMLIVTPLSITNLPQNNFSIHPNPVTKILTIESNNPITKIELINSLGQLVHIEYTNSYKVEVDIEKIISGIYLVRLNNIYSEKIMKN